MKTALLAASALATLAVHANAPKNATPPAADPNAPTGDAGNQAPATEATGKKPRKARETGEVLAIVADIPVPEVVSKRGGSLNKSPYPFDALGVNQSFGVKGKDRDSMSSIVSNQNRRKDNQRAKLDAAGAKIPVMVETKDANGVVIGRVAKHPPEFEMERIKEFVVADVDPIKDPQGASVRVWRTK